ncbi:MAG TPA: DsbA family oxidoreductase [Nitrospira sp.]|nr:DsbA family oxidoreductase [Nitrospira sp.]
MKDLAQQMAGVSIEIYSDVICPWCYIGKRRLERALERLGGAVKAQIAWRPFQLNPTMPKEGMERRRYLEEKFGSLNSFRPIEQQVLEAGAAEGISFAFGKMTRTPNTFLAHRMIWYGGRQGVQDAVVTSLFRGYFEEGVDIGSVPALMQLSERAGLDAGPLLRSEDGTAEVNAEEVEGHRLGIRAVPYFVVNRAYGISGAQPAERFLSVIERVTADPPIETGLATER